MMEKAIKKAIEEDRKEIKDKIWQHSSRIQKGALQDILDFLKQ